MCDGENKLLNLFMFFELLIGGRMWVCISFWNIAKYQDNFLKKIKGWTAWEILDAKC